MQNVILYRFRIVLLVVMIISCLQNLTNAALITITSNKDTTIFQNNVNNSAGGQTGVFSGTNNSLSPRRGLMSFDIAGNVPAGSTITDVKLTLTLTQIAGSGGGGGSGVASATIGLFPLSKNWGEGVVSAGAGQGSAAGVGDATWNAAAYSPTTPTLWTTPGGDFVNSASASQAIGVTLTTYTWGSTSSLVADVQGWLDSAATNFGWLLKNNDETSAQTFRVFGTRELAASTPQLAITYVPEPTGMFVVVGAIALCFRRKANR